MVWIALPLSLAYVGLCGFMYLRQRDLLYLPQATRVDQSQTDFAFRRHGVTLRGWVVNPGQDRALLYFGGNAEAVQLNRDNFARWFPRHTVYLVAYRGFGASDGSPTETHLVGDALALYDRVRRTHRGAVPDVLGRSLGSGVASQVASRRPVRRLALITPYDTIASVGQAHYRWLPVGLIAKDRFDSVSHLASYKGPLLVVRAGRDTVIPPANTQRLIDSLAQRPKVVEVAGADHSSITLDPAYARALTRFFVEPPLPTRRNGRHDQPRRVPQVRQAAAPRPDRKRVRAERHP